MDLSTTYLGIELPHPFMPGASPMVDDLDTVRRLEDAGAAAIVMHSLFEEQIAAEQIATFACFEEPAESFSEAVSYFPEPPPFRLGPEEYLEQVARIREAVAVPVIASLNGTTTGGWIEYARMLAEAGAHALELNVYQLATDPDESGEEIERRTVELVSEVCRSVAVPVAVKLSPYYTALSHFARRLERAGVAGLILFNRFYQPDIDVEALEVTRELRLSDSSELNLRLRWLAILTGRVRVSLAVTGGVHTGLDAVKAVMAGADGVQMVSALLRNGPEHVARVRREVEAWLEEHGYDSLRQMQGSMSLVHCPDPKAYERANYIQMLQSWER